MCAEKRRNTVDNASTPVTVLVFGALRRFMDDQNLPYELKRPVPEEGISAYDIAESISVPPSGIEAVFRNGRVINIHDRVYPKDRLAFFPYGTPGPYRVFLGMVRENKKRKLRETVSASE
ncbi:MAG: MoaD/ThiS family protein [Deltaproteobacteria bacterium]|nr:MoaD/ThiS family protein [Deltaproteobacteria bacterium]